MKKLITTGILGAMLLLPVFLYLILSGNNRPVTVVPNEFNYNMKAVLSLPENDSKVHLFIFDYPDAIQDLLWFEGLLGNSSCYDINLIAKGKEIDFDLYDLKNSKSTVLEVDVESDLSRFEGFFNAFIVDEYGELRAVYDLLNLKERERAKIELYIMLENNKLCQKSS